MIEIELNTRLWQRSNTSYATTIPQAFLINLDLPNKRYIVKWELKDGKVIIEFKEENE